MDFQIFSGLHIPHPKQEKSEDILSRIEQTPIISRTSVFDMLFACHDDICEYPVMIEESGLPKWELYQGETVMPYLMVINEVEDYARWRPAFDDHGRVRREFGCLSEQVFRDADDPNIITLLFEWDSFENAEDFLNESGLREVMQKAGVIGQPTITFLNEA
jgi:quinol monooxygenase YgiN